MGTTNPKEKDKSGCYKTIRKGKYQFVMKGKNLLLANALKFTCRASGVGRRMSS